MEAVYELGNRITLALLKQKITVGDIIAIDRTTNKVTKKGRSSSSPVNFDACDQVFVACPEGELQKSVERVNCVSLHDIDVVNSNSSGGISIFSGDFGEIRSETRNQIDSRLKSWIKDGKARTKNGILLIEEIFMLDAECFSFLNRCLESEFAPLVILTTNKSASTVRGIEYMSAFPFGIPSDFLERCVLLHTEEYTKFELKSIISSRVDEENIIITDEDALDILIAIATETSSLRYTLQILSVSCVIKDMLKDSSVNSQHISRALNLFKHS